MCLLELYFIAGSAPYNKMTTRILEECHETFVSCFHAFYPTAYLKWISLCDLLALVDKVSEYKVLRGVIYRLRDYLISLTVSEFLNSSQRQWRKCDHGLTSV